MAYTFLLTGNAQERNIALVRNETGDKTTEQNPTFETDYFLSDEEIDAFLETAREEAPRDANETEIRLMACGAILDNLATNEAYVFKKQRTLADETDGPAVAKEIRVHAATCRSRVANSLKDRRARVQEEADEAASRGKRPRRPSSGGISIRSVF